MTAWASPEAIDAALAPQVSGCRFKGNYSGSRFAAVYCTTVGRSEGYRIRGLRYTWQGKVGFAGNWATRSDIDGSHYSSPTAIVVNSFWVESACCFTDV